MLEGLGGCATFELIGTLAMDNHGGLQFNFDKETFCRQGIGSPGSFHVLTAASAKRRENVFQSQQKAYELANRADR